MGGRIRRVDVANSLRDGIRGRTPAYVKLGVAAIVVAELADLFLTYSAMELLLGGNITGTGLASEAERAKGLVSGIEALLSAIVAAVVVLVLPAIGARCKRPWSYVLPLTACAVSVGVGAVRYIGQVSSGASMTAEGIAGQAISATGGDTVALTAAAFALITMLCMLATVALSHALTKLRHDPKREAMAELAECNYKIGYLTEQVRWLEEGEAVSPIDAAATAAKAEIDLLTYKY